MVHTPHRPFPLDHLGLPDAVLDPLLLQTALLHAHPPRGLDVVAFQAELATRRARRTALVTLLSPHTTGIASCGWSITVDNVVVDIEIPERDLLSPLALEGCSASTLAGSSAGTSAEIWGWS